MPRSGSGTHGYCRANIRRGGVGGGGTGTQGFVHQKWPIRFSRQQISFLSHFDWGGGGGRGVQRGGGGAPPMVVGRAHASLGSAAAPDQGAPQYLDGEKKILDCPSIRMQSAWRRCSIFPFDFDFAFFLFASVLHVLKPLTRFPGPNPRDVGGGGPEGGVPALYTQLGLDRGVRAFVAGGGGVDRALWLDSPLPKKGSIDAPPPPQSY